MQTTMAQRLQRQVEEHTQWLADNCSRQVPSNAKDLAIACEEKISARL
jgi:hypothetical protein